jgi:hypothetical protein
MENALSISPDVFLEGSSFMMWWDEWKEYKKNQVRCCCSFMMWWEE